MVQLSIPQNKIKTILVYIIDSELIWKQTTQTYIYKKNERTRIKQMINEKKEEWFLDKNSEILIIRSSDNLNDIGKYYIKLIRSVFEDEELNLIVKNIKHNKLKLFLRKLYPFEIADNNTERISTTIHSSYMDYNQKIDFQAPIIFYFQQNTVFSEIHLQIYSIFLPILKEVAGFQLSWLNSSLLDEGEIYEKHILNQFWILQFRATAKANSPCCFCNKRSYSDCDIPYDKYMDLSTCLAKQSHIKVEIYVIWNKPFINNGQIDNFYLDWQASQNISIEEDINNQTTPKNGYSEKGNNQVQLFSDFNFFAPIDDQQVQEEPKQLVANQVETSCDQTIDLAACLLSLAKPEKLSDGNTWQCSQCNQQVYLIQINFESEAIKTLQIYKASNILIFHLKRFKDSAKLFKTKLNMIINFPFQLNMKKFVLNTNLPEEFGSEEFGDQVNINEELMYDLYGICNHHGNLGSGHYTAYCKNPKFEKWYEFNDDQVKEVQNLQNMISSDAYILFYRRRNDKDSFDWHSVFE